MSTSFIIGFCVGILVVAIVCIILSKKNCRNKYDERQKAIQGVAYKFGFLAMVAYFIANGIVCMLLDDWLPTFIMNFIGICFGIVCYAGYAIFKDAYISLNAKPLRFLIYLALVSAFNYLVFFVNSQTNKGTPEIYLTNLICAILLTTVCAMIIIKIIIDKSREKKELVEE